MQRDSEMMNVGRSGWILQVMLACLLEVKALLLCKYVHQYLAIGLLDIEKQQRGGSHENWQDSLNKECRSKPNKGKNSSFWEILIVVSPDRTARKNV